MNIPRLLLAIVIGFIVIFGTDFLIHGKLMAPDYQATQQLWRTDAEMQARFVWMMGAQLLTTVAFLLLWTRWAPTARLGCALGFGFLMGLFSGVWPIVLYVVLPMPGSIALKWFFAGLVQCLLLGLVAFLIYRPKEPAAA